MMTLVQLLLLHHRPNMVPSDDDDSGPAPPPPPRSGSSSFMERQRRRWTWGDGGGCVGGDGGGGAGGGRGDRDPCPCRRWSGSPRCPSPLAMRRHDERRARWGRRENTPIYRSLGRVRTMHMRIRRLLEAATVVFWRDFSHAGDDGSAGDSLNGAIVFLFLKRFSLERSSPRGRGLDKKNQSSRAERD
jgi:hypothetical protein